MGFILLKEYSYNYHANTVATLGYNALRDSTTITC